MSYIGNTPSGVDLNNSYIGNSPFTTSHVDNFNGDGSTTAFTLTKTPASTADDFFLVFVDNVYQREGGSYAFTVSGSTITFTSAPASGTNNIQVYQLGSEGIISTISDGTVTADKLGTSAVETAKIANGSVTSAKLDTNIDVSGSVTADSINLNAGYGSDAAIYGVRAWVNFDGTTNSGGNCTIRDSGNVSSVADNGTGDYTVNFTSAMPDTNYAWSGSIKPDSGADADGQLIENRDNARTTSTLRIITREFSSDQTDPLIVQLSVVR